MKRLCVLPYDLVVDEPTAESVKHVIEFAKKTGDYLSLSSADLKVIALTYQLEKELVGTKHLRNTPIVAKTIASKEKPNEFVETKPLVGFYNPPQSEVEVTQKNIENRSIIADKLDEEKKNAKENCDNEIDAQENSEDSEDSEEHKEYETTEDELVDKLSKLDAGLVTENEANEILVSITKNKNDPNSGDTETDKELSEEDEEDDDNDTWITPKNIQEKKTAAYKDVVEDTPVRVACMSTDFAVQNVLKQINLNIAALDGRIIKQMRTYILRCYACFKTTSIMTKVFCPNCGHKTLKKVAVSMNEDGQQVIHINTRKQLTAKNKNKSMPLPRGGKHSSNPILMEDQPIPKQFPTRVARTKTNALDDDYVAGKLIYIYFI